MGLFRQPALDASSERLHGDIMLVPRTPHALLCLLLAAWVAATAIFLTQASYSRKETVRGWLEPAAGVVRIYPLGEGRIARLLVGAGDRVASGQPLAIINNDRALPGGGQLEALLLDEYLAQQANLQRQLNREQAMQRTRQREQDARLEACRMELEQLDRQISLLDRRIALAGARRERHRKLADSGHVSRATLDDLQERALLLEAERHSLGLQRLRQGALLKELQASLERMPGEFANSLDKLRLELSEISQQIARLRVTRGRVVQAPVAGEIASLGVTAGQSARYDKPIMTLLPAESPLVARLSIPMRAAGFLREGQRLAIRYDAFPYQKYGLKHGHIVHLTRSAMLPADLAHWPVPVSEPVFRATARLLDGESIHDAEPVSLRSGMTLSAEIILEPRSILQWLLEPLYSAKGRLT